MEEIVVGEGKNSANFLASHPAGTHPAGTHPAWTPPAGPHFKKGKKGGGKKKEKKGGVEGKKGRGEKKGKKREEEGKGKGRRKGKGEREGFFFFLRRRGNERSAKIKNEPNHTQERSRPNFGSRLEQVGQVRSYNVNPIQHSPSGDQRRRKRAAARDGQHASPSPSPHQKRGPLQRNWRVPTAGRQLSDETHALITPSSAGFHGNDN